MSADLDEIEAEEALIRCGTSKGDIVLHLYRKWSPHGYDRAVALYEHGFYDHSHFFRTVPNFLVQFGISYTDDADLKKKARSTIPDDPQLDPPIPFDEGTISYAGSGPNSRTSQLFIALASLPSFGTQLWETPIGEIEQGMDVVEHFYSYGDMPPWGKGPVQQKIHSGPAYIEENFPLTDRFTTCQVQRLRTAAERDAELTDPSDDTADEVPPELLERPEQLRHAEDTEHNVVALSTSKLPTLSVVAGIAILAVVWWWWRWLLGRSQQKSSKSV